MNQNLGNALAILIQAVFHYASNILLYIASLKFDFKIEKHVNREDYSCTNR